MLSRRVGYVLLLAALAATLPLLIGTTVPGLLWLIVPTALLTLVAGRLAERFSLAPRFILGVALVGAALGCYSILTGRFNGLSDEPYSTPAYASLGLGMYSHPVSFTYVQYGRTYLETSYDVYLPLLTYLQAPGVDYRWVSLGAWAATFLLLRRDRFAAVAWASPWIVTLAANGQNDFVPLLLVTVALVRRPVRLGWLAEVAALAVKQFANVLVFFYHVARGEYFRAASAVVVTLAVLLPFLWLDPGAVWCHVVVGDPGTACQGHPWTFFVFKRNYWLYPTWAALAFHSEILRRLRRWFPLRRV